MRRNTDWNKSKRKGSRSNQLHPEHEASTMMIMLMTTIMLSMTTNDGRADDDEDDDDDYDGDGDNDDYHDKADLKVGLYALWLWKIS